MKLTLFIAVIAILWIGMILAIGMESVVKFHTPTLTKPVAFDVGRTVFSAFNKVQLGLLVLIIVGTMMAGSGFFDKMLAIGLLAVLVLQIFWLFPDLSQRVDLILSGTKPPATYKHGLYGLLELAKLALLVILAWRLLSVSL